MPSLAKRGVGLSTAWSRGGGGEEDGGRRRKRRTAFSWFRVSRRSFFRRTDLVSCLNSRFDSSATHRRRREAILASTTERDVGKAMKLAFPGKARGAHLRSPRGPGSNGSDGLRSGLPQIEARNENPEKDSRVGKRDKSAMPSRPKEYRHKHVRDVLFFTDPQSDVAPGKPGAAMCVRNVDVQCVLQFTLFHAVGCVLHRPTSRVIHRLELYLFELSL